MGEHRSCSRVGDGCMLYVVPKTARESTTYRPLEICSSRTNYTRSSFTTEYKNSYALETELKQLAKHIPWIDEFVQLIDYIILLASIR